MSASSPTPNDPQLTPPAPVPRIKKGPGTPRSMRNKSDKFSQNIEKRGIVSSERKKKDEGPGVGPIVLAFILFVVLGSAVLQVLRGW
ncbi:MAG: RAMP4 family protein [archaeon]|nr:RAMP4 family protein [archaeon]